MATQKILLIALLFMACTVLTYSRPMIDTSDIVKDIRDIENILNESDTDTSDDDDDDEDDSKESTAPEDDDKEDDKDDKDDEGDKKSTDASLEGGKNNSSEGTPVIEDVSNSTDTNDTKPESSNNVAASNDTNTNSTNTEATASTTAEADKPSTDKPSSDAAKSVPSKKAHIGVGQRLTSEQKDDPEVTVTTPNEFAKINPAATPSDSTSSDDSKSNTFDTPSANTAKVEKTSDAVESEKPKEASPAIESPRKEEPKEEVKLSEKAPALVMAQAHQLPKKENELKEVSPQAAPRKEEKSGESHSQKKDVEEVVGKGADKIAANKPSADEENDDDNEDDEDEDDSENVGNDKPAPINEDSKSTSEEEDEETTDVASASENEKSRVDDFEEVDPHNEDDRVKMFFISPYEREETTPRDVETASVRQILTYPATTGHGWGHSHQWGPSHIWNSDYPYFAYGYSWGCGNHNGDHHGAMRKSNIRAKGKEDSDTKLKSEKRGKGKAGKTKKSKKSTTHGKTDWICRDYMLVPASPRGALLDPDMVDAQRGTARQNVYSKDVACNEDDQRCRTRQVIGSMAGGSLFGDGMGGLGMGFPGVPGIHAGLSGYNEMGGFGDHEHGCNNGGGHCNAGYGGGFGGGGGGGGGGPMGGGGGPMGGGIMGGSGGGGGGPMGGGGGPMGGGGGGPFLINDRAISNFWGERQNLPQFIGSGMIEMGDLVKKSSNPKRNSYGYGGLPNSDISNAYEGQGFNPLPAFSGGSRYSEGYTAEPMNGLRKFDSLSNGPENQNYFGNQGWGNTGSGALLRQGGDLNGWGQGMSSENGGNTLVSGGGGYMGNGIENFNNGVDSYFGGKEPPMGTPYIGSGNDYGIGRTVHSVVNAESQGKLGLQGKISINGIHKNFSYKSKIKKHKEKPATARQDIAMPDEQAMMEITKQRQLIGSLGASTLFADNVGGMGLGHPGVPGMSSGISGIPGEYGGTGGYSHGWDGENQPGLNPHGFAHYAYSNRDSDHDHENVYRGQQPDTDSAHRRTQILPGDGDYDQIVRSINQPQVGQQPQKMSEIERMVHDVSDSIDKTNRKLQAIQSNGGKRQITPAFTPVVSEPAAVPDIRYPVPAADRYPLGAGYIWPSANYGHQLGGPFAWSKSSTPSGDKKADKSRSEKKIYKAKGEAEKKQHAKKAGNKHLKKERRSVDKSNNTSTEKMGTKRQFLAHPYERSSEAYPYHGGMPIYGSGMGYPLAHGAGFTGHAGTQRAFARHFHTMGDGGGGYGGGYQGGYHGGYGHRLRASHSFLPTLSGRYANYANHEAGGYGGGLPMSLHHQSMYNGGGVGGGGVGGGGVYEGSLHGLMGGHDAGGLMGGHEGGGGGGGGGGDGGYQMNGHGSDGGYGSLSAVGGGLGGYSHNMGGGMMEDHQSVPEGSPFGHGYNHAMQFAMPPEESHPGYMGRHSGGYAGNIGGPVPGGFESGGGLGGGLGSLGGAGVGGMVNGGGLPAGLDQGFPPSASHSVDGGYGGGAGDHLSGYGRQSLDQQQPDQPAGDASSFAPMIHNQMQQMPQMIPEPQQAMFSPNEQQEFNLLPKGSMNWPTMY